MEPPQKAVRTPKNVKVSGKGKDVTPLKHKKVEELVTASAKKRGRPTREALQVREKERQEAIARGEPDPELKRRRRKPNKLKDGASEESEDVDSGKDEKTKKMTKREEKELKKREKEEAKRKEKEEKMEAKRKRKIKKMSSGESEGEEPKKRGRQKKVLTEEEIAIRDAERKAKYAAIREAQKEKKARREAYLIR